MLHSRTRPTALAALAAASLAALAAPAQAHDRGGSIDHRRVTGVAFAGHTAYVSACSVCKGGGQVLAIRF